MSWLRRKRTRSWRRRRANLELVNQTQFQDNLTICPELAGTTNTYSSNPKPQSLGVQSYAFLLSCFLSFLIYLVIQFCLSFSLSLSLSLYIYTYMHILSLSLYIYIHTCTYTSNVVLCIDKHSICIYIYVCIERERERTFRHLALSQYSLFSNTYINCRLCRPQSMQCNACMDGWIDGWMDGWMGRWMFMCLYAYVLNVLCMFMYVYIYVYDMCMYICVCMCPYVYV